MTSFRDSSGSFTAAGNQSLLWSSRDDDVESQHRRLGDNSGQLQQAYQSGHQRVSRLTPSSSALPEFTSQSALPPQNEFGIVLNEPLATLDLVAVLPNVLADRQKLMAHITYLNIIVQRLQLQLHHQMAQTGSGPLLSEFDTQTLQQQFDPIVATTQIKWLETNLAQCSIQLEAGQAAAASLSRDKEALEVDRQRLRDTVASLDAELRDMKRWRSVAQEFEVQQKELTEELDRLRKAEVTLTRKLRNMKSFLHSDNRRADDSLSDNDSEEALQRSAGNRTAAASSPQRLEAHPPTSNTGGSSYALGAAMPNEEHEEGLEEHEEQFRLQRLCFEMNETAYRQDMFIEEMFFTPLRAALEAGIVFRRELDMLREQEALRDVEVPPVAVAGAAASGEGDAAASTNALNRSAQQDALAAQRELESMRHDFIFQQIQVQRLERLLDAERQRNQQLAKDHLSQMEAIHDGIAAERLQYTARLEAEVNKAFREGMLRERANRKAKKESHKLLKESEKALHRSASSRGDDVDEGQ